MIALDTNVLIRLVTLDDPAQAERARRLLARCTPEVPAFVAREVLVELVWSLTRRLRVPRSRVADVLDGLLGSAEIEVESAEAVARSVEAYRGGLDFGDAMIAEAARSRGVDLWTFDRKAARMDGVRLLEAGAV